MITILTTITLIIIGIFLLHIDKYDFLSGIGLIFAGAGSLILVISTVIILTAPKDFDNLVSLRNTTSESYKEIRLKNYGDNEINSDINKINNNINRQKEKNQSVFYDWFIDDRIETLQTIKY